MIRHEINCRAQASKGFSLVELLIALAVTVIFMYAIYFLYVSSVQAFKITDWKQQRTAQAQMFWDLLRTPLEEANLHIVPDSSGVSVILNTVARPLILKETVSADTITAVNILEWSVDHFDPVAESVETAAFKLYVKANKLFLDGGRFSNKIVLEDVNEVKAKATKIFQRDEAGAFEEFIADTAAVGDVEVGNIIEITIVLKPRSGIGPKNLKLIQSCKFRVETTVTTLP